MPLSDNSSAENPKSEIKFFASRLQLSYLKDLFIAHKAPSRVIYIDEDFVFKVLLLHLPITCHVSGISYIFQVQCELTLQA